VLLPCGVVNDDSVGE